MLEQQRINHALEGAERIAASKRVRFQGGGKGPIADYIYGNSGVRVVGFGRFYPEGGERVEQDWSLRHLRAPEAERARCSLVKHLPGIVQKLGIRYVLAPSPVQFNGKVCRMSQLREEIPVGDCVVRRGVEADSCILNRGEALIISVGGCAVGWISHPGLAYSPPDRAAKYRHVGASHMGLKSLEAGVIPNLANAVGLTKETASFASAGYAFPIDASIYEHRWDHPHYGAQNEARCRALVKAYGKESVLRWTHSTGRRLGRINLEHIIRRQFEMVGIPPERIYGTPSLDTHLHSDGQPLWYTTRGPHSTRRNLAIIHHLDD